MSPYKSHSLHFALLGFALLVNLKAETASSPASDSLEAALLQASVPPEQSEPLTVTLAATQAKAESEAAPVTLPGNVPGSAGVELPQGGANQVLVAPQSDASAGMVGSQLNPSLTQDPIVDPLIAERARIRLVGDYSASFRNAPVHLVVRAIAEMANMRFITDNSEELATPVTIRGTYNVLDLLDILQEHYGVSMTFERNVWRLGRKRPDSLVYRIYTIRNNSRETVEITSPTVQNSLGSGGGSTSTTTGGGGEGSFKVENEGLTKDVKEILGIPLPAGLRDPAAASDATASSRVFFVPETSQLHVVAPEFHQGKIREYLAEVDKPIDAIEFTAYFVESSRSPEQEIGIDWTNAITSQVSGASPANDLNFTVPRAMILNEFEFAAALNFTKSDTQSWIAQQPTVVGMPNRKTVLDATQQVPVAQSSTSNNTTATNTTTSSLQYLNVGTIVNIWPVIMNGEDGSQRIRLHISLVVSSISGEKIISGNPAPITSTRRFEFTAEVPDTSTLVIGGLVSNETTKTSSKVPFLSDIPGLGRVFGSDKDTVSRTNMTCYITPRIVKNGRAVAVPDLPRVWPQDLSFNRPVFDLQTATLASVRYSLEGFARELETLETYELQKRDPAIISKRLRGLQGELDDMRSFLKQTRRSGVAVDRELSSAIEAHDSRASALRFQVIAGYRL